MQSNVREHIVSEKNPVKRVRIETPKQVLTLIQLKVASKELNWDDYERPFHTFNFAGPPVGSMC